jgi:hypothetical protein
MVADAEIPENNPQPATLVIKGKKTGKGLSEPMVAFTDTGVRMGDPRTAEKRRAADLQGATRNGTVKVPRKVDSGTKLKSGAPRMTTKMVDVPVTEEHVREARAYWLKRRITPKTPESVRKAQAENVAALSRMLESLQAAHGMPVAIQPAFDGMADAASAQRGPTLVRGRDTTPRVRDASLPWSESADVRRNGETRKTTTLDQPLGRERFDRKITDVPEPAPKRSRSATRRFRRKLAAQGKGSN